VSEQKLAVMTESGILIGLKSALKQVLDRFDA
jgi:hypothetical protein